MEEIDIDVRAGEQGTPLDIAVRLQHQGIIDLLKRTAYARNNPNDVVGDEGKTKLMIAIESKSDRVVSLIGHPNFKPNLGDNTGRSALYYAVKSESINIIRKLLDFPGIDCNKATFKGCTPLYVAAHDGLSEIVKMMLETNNIDVNASLKSSQETPLLVAVCYGRTDVVRLLLSHPAIKCNITTCDGRSAFYTAVERGNIKMVRLFLEKSELNFDQTYKGKTA